MSDSCKCFEVSGYVIQENGIIRNPSGKILCRINEIQGIISDLETERLRLAACGVAAIGYHTEKDDIEEQYKSASLQDIFNLYEQKAALQERCERLEKALHEAMEWNWIDGDVPQWVIDQLEQAL